MYSQKKACLFLFLWAWSVLFQVVWIRYFWKEWHQNDTRSMNWNHHLDGQKKMRAKSHFHFLIPLPPQKKTGKHVCHVWCHCNLLLFLEVPWINYQHSCPSSKDFCGRLCHQPLPSIWIHKVLGPNDLGIQGSRKATLRCPIFFSNQATPRVFLTSPEIPSSQAWGIQAWCLIWEWGKEPKKNKRGKLLQSSHTQAGILDNVQLCTPFDFQAQDWKCQKFTGNSKTWFLESKSHLSFLLCLLLFSFHPQIGI